MDGGGRAGTSSQKQRLPAKVGGEAAIRARDGANGEKQAASAPSVRASCEAATGANSAEQAATSCCPCPEKNLRIKYWRRHCAHCT